MATLPRTQVESMRRQADLSASKRQNADQELLTQRRKLDALAQESGGMSKEDLRAMQQRFDAANKDIQGELEELRIQFGQELGKQALENKRALAEIRRLAEGNKRDLDSLNEEILSLEKSVKGQFERLEKLAQDNRKQALYYYGQLRNIVAQIDERFPDKYEVLYPDQLQPGAYVLRSVLGSVLEDIDRGNFEAAIGLAQTRLPEAVSVLAQLEFYHTAFLNAEMETKKTVSALMTRVRDLEKPKKTELLIGKGGEYEDKYGISYWARELFEEIKRRLSDTESRFDICDESNDSEGLALIRQDADKLNDQLSACEQIEANERRLHFECCECASQVFDILDSNDPGLWKLEELHINEEDLREPVYMTLVRPEGYRITVACYPERAPGLTASGIIRCELEVFDNGTEKDDAARCCIIYSNIATILAAGGISLDSQPRSELSAANSKSFIHSAIDHEGQARTKWLNAAKKAMGLFEEV